MFGSRRNHNDSFSKHRAGKSAASRNTSAVRTKRSFQNNNASASHKGASFSKRADKERPKVPPSLNAPRYEYLPSPLLHFYDSHANTPACSSNSNLTSPIITLAIGPSERLFAAHASILSTSPFFAAIARGTYLESTSQRILLPEETPEVFSSVLEYLYKGDYYPKLLHNKRLDTWQLEDQDKDVPMDGSGAHEAENGTTAVWHEAAQQVLLKDTLVYCTAERYGLDELKRLALRKQGLQSGIQVATILASAKYAYANTPDSDSKLRAHYLALIIRSRGVFKRSGTMQMEMEAGGSLWFDLFVAMCNHMVRPSTMSLLDFLLTQSRTILQQPPSPPGRPAAPPGKNKPPRSPTKTAPGA